ncbi:MAG: lipocalin family protein [Gemmatimonadetes bacterium]|nr:lipocalin family protein [Gemmatimonadota bacterium]
MRIRPTSIVSCLVLAVSCEPANAQPAAVRALDSLDLVRYAGRWHEVARLPNRFQRNCAADATATYELDGDAIRVINTCRDSAGAAVRAEGRGRLADRRGPASRLKVRFAPRALSFLPMVWADYWVLDLTEDYSAALVGTPDRAYLWILSRQPSLDAAVYDQLVATAARQGFDVSRIMRAGSR